MRKNISAIIIDTDKDKHDYTNVVTTHHYIGEETHIDLCVVENVENEESALRLLAQHRGFDALITIGNNINVQYLNQLSFEFRKKWVHFENFDANAISTAIIATLKCNILREREGQELFSIFTSAYNTPDSVIYRLYDSLKKQTYHNWNWFILDDSTQPVSWINTLSLDPRVTIIKNITHHGNIGFNKHLIASICDGDYLVEIDHDDELVPECLEKLLSAFNKFDADFVYSYALELIDGRPIYYGEDFALGLGTYKTLPVNGKMYTIPLSPDINALSLRHIVGLPNHVRCWKKSFYQKIGGHNQELSVLDDMDLLIRTFLNDGVMVKIPEVLYIQHEGTSEHSGRGSTTQSVRMSEILRMGRVLLQKYDPLIHQKLIQLYGEDPVWDDEEHQSNLYEVNYEKLLPYNKTF